MGNKPQKHHYETSRTVSLRSLIFSFLIFGLLMFYFVYIRGRPFDLAYSNRAFAITAVFLIGSSYILGPFARFSKKFTKKLVYRKPLGLYGYAFAILHVLISLLTSGEELATNGYSLFFGMMAILIFSFVAASSMVKSIEAFGFDRWQKIQRMGYVAFVFVIIHFSIIDSGQFIGRQLGQLTLAFALLVIFARILTLFVKKK